MVPKFQSLHKFEVHFYMESKNAALFLFCVIVIAKPIC